MEAIVKVVKYVCVRVSCFDQYHKYPNIFTNDQVKCTVILSVTVLYKQVAYVTSYPHPCTRQVLLVSDAEGLTR